MYLLVTIKDPLKVSDAIVALVQKGFVQLTIGENMEDICTNCQNRKLINHLIESPSLSECHNDKAQKRCSKIGTKLECPFLPSLRGYLKITAGEKTSPETAIKTEEQADGPAEQFTSIDEMYDVMEQNNIIVKPMNAFEIYDDHDYLSTPRNCPQNKELKIGGKTIATEIAKLQAETNYLAPFKCSVSSSNTFLGQRTRPKFTSWKPWEVRVLETFYSINMYANKDDSSMQEMVRMLKVDAHCIRLWFQCRRRNEKVTAKRLEKKQFKLSEQKATGLKLFSLL